MIPMHELKWSNLSRRERGLITIGVCVLLGYFIYSNILEPHYRRYHALQEQIPHKAQTFDWMKAQVQIIAPLLKRSDDRPHASTNGMSLVATLEDSMKRKGLSDKVKRVRPKGIDEVQIWFSDINFNEWVSWLDQLRRHNIESTSTRVERSENGLTSIQVTLRAANMGAESGS